MKINQTECQMFLRTDFVAFVHRAFYELYPETTYLHNWHIEVIGAALEECRMGTLAHLIIPHFLFEVDVRSRMIEPIRVFMRL
jgi:hypothetical protein